MQQALLSASARPFSVYGTGYFAQQGGLTYNLYQQLCASLPADYTGRLVSAEVACTRWLETLVEDELQYYPHLVRATHAIITECYSPRTLTPGVTTTDDLQWAFWQYSQALGLELPAGVGAVEMNIVAVDATARGNMAAFPWSATPPALGTFSTINFADAGTTGRQWGRELSRCA